MVNDNLWERERGEEARGGRRLAEAGVTLGQLIPSVSDEGMPAHLAHKHTHTSGGGGWEGGEVGAERWRRGEGQRTVNTVLSHDCCENGSRAEYINSPQGGPCPSASRRARGKKH